MRWILCDARSVHRPQASLPVSPKRRARQSRRLRPTLPTCIEAVPQTTDEGAHRQGELQSHVEPDSSRRAVPATRGIVAPRRDSFLTGSMNLTRPRGLLHVHTQVARASRGKNDPMTSPRSDAFVLFGATGDLAYKKIFPALHAMARAGE